MNKDVTGVESWGHVFVMVTLGTVFWFIASNAF